MQLFEIEKAIRKNCIMAKGNHFLHTDIDFELSTKLGLIVFAGIARQIGFKQKEVNEYLGITPAEHTLLLDVFTKSHKNYALDAGKDLFSNMTVEKRIVLKTFFVNNTLKIGKPKSDMLPVRMFGY